MPDCVVGVDIKLLFHILSWRSTAEENENRKRSRSDRGCFSPIFYPKTDSESAETDRTYFEISGNMQNQIVLQFPQKFKLGSDIEGIFILLSSSCRLSIRLSISPPTTEGSWESRQEARTSQRGSWIFLTRKKMLRSLSPIKNMKRSKYTTSSRGFLQNMVSPDSGERKATYRYQDRNLSYFWCTVFRRSRGSLRNS